MKNQSDVFQPGDPVLFIDRKFREYYDVLEAEKSKNIRGDLLPHDEIIGRGEGFLISSQRGTPFQVYRPTIGEHVRLMRRGAQVIYPKDIAMILVWGDIYPGAKVVECGLGSGALTSALLRAVGEKGSVTSYEIREDFTNNANKNLDNFIGERPNHIIKNSDIYETFDEENVDRLVLDVPEPWQAIETATPRLRPGAVITSYSPTIRQVDEFVKKLLQLKTYSLIQTLESFVREWKVDAVSVRPKMRMVAHTAFLTFARYIPGLKPTKTSQ